MKLYSTVKGEGEAVILLHGLFGSGDNLSMVARSLAERFSVYSVDLPNHGRSERVEQMTLSSMAADVAAFMDQNALESAHFLGHSLGGKVAMQLAVTQPQRVSRLVVADIAPVSYSAHHQAVFAALQSVDLNTIKNRAEADRKMSRFIEEQGVRQFLLKSLYRNDSGEYRWRMNLAAIHANYDALRAGITEGQPFEGQTLFIKGGDSDYILAEHREAIEHWFPHFRFKQIDGAGHWLHAEKTAAFNGLVSRFLTAS